MFVIVLCCMNVCNIGVCFCAAGVTGVLYDLT